MATLEVWHVNNTPAARERRISYEFREGDAPRFPEDYDLVARVEVEDPEDLDRAYELTNHIDRPWFDNEGVSVVRRGRSTSVADVIVSEGVAYRVARPVGYERLEGEHPHLTVVK